MRVLIAPDDFKGTLTAPQAAEAIAAGWRSAAPDDDVVLLPLSDGGPGFVMALAESAAPAHPSGDPADDGHLVPVGVRGPLGDTAIGMVLMVGDTAYVESAHACGLALVPEHRRNAGAASTYGVGQLIAAALDAGARWVVVGLGGSATTDGGAGMLAALGARAYDADGDEVPLDAGGVPLARMCDIDLSSARERTASVELVAASDVDAPLLGAHGAARGFAPQKGAGPADVEQLEDALAVYASAMARSEDDLDLASHPGAGAAGGLGYALLLLGARRVPGIETVMRAVDFDRHVAECDLVITGEGCFDWQSLRGKVVSGVAAAGLARARPIVVIAGRVEVGRREYSALGVAEACAVYEQPPDTIPSPSRAAADLAARTARLAGQWSR